MNPLQVLQQGPLWREMTTSRVFFDMSLEFNKRSPDKKKKLTLLLKALGKQCPPMFPKMGSLWKQTLISRALLNISFRVPSKGALPPDSPYRVPTVTDAPFPEPSFIPLSKFPVNEPPSWFPSRAPMERDAYLHSLPLHILQDLQ